uniref:PKD/REJ-like domain-containing protein n=1 Tax=Anopheles atroparvus TaxID=41427 RepID=A0AAG5CX16_ANOAO
MYVFEVVGVAEDGTTSDEQNFTMTYRSPEQGASFESVDNAVASNDDVSLLLLGSETFYADVEYGVTAQLIFCHRRTDYFFRWTVADLDEPSVAVNMERSKTLRIPAGSFTPGRTYSIQVEVLASSGDQNILARARMLVTVLLRHPTMVLIPAEAIVGIDRPTSILAHVTGGGSAADSIRWTCLKEGDTSECENTMEIGDDTTVTFYKAGRYSITASLGTNETESESGTTLSVHSKVTPSVRVLEWSQYPAVSGQPFRMLVSVSGLVPNCRSNWTVLREEGFAYFDPTQIPTDDGQESGSLGGFFIRDIEENFLSELVDYGNDTVVKDSVLFIPGANAGAVGGSWSGLAPDARYKLRLETVCPEPFDDSQPPAVGQRERMTIASHWTFVLETNGPPRGLPIEVSPATNGTALETVFQFISGIAKDTDGDYPLRYSYWYVADGVEVNVGSYYEITSTETVLPYTRNGTVRTYVVVCDSREACATVDGPVVHLVAGKEPSNEDITFALESIESFFGRLNLREALKTAFEILITLRNRNSPLYADTYRRFVDIFRQAVERVGTVYGETTYLSEATIQEFVMQAKPILDLEEAANHELFQQLLELMETTAPRSKRSGTQPLVSSSSPVSAGKINAKLYLMEGMTASNNASVARQSRTALLNYVHQAAKSYCTGESHHVYVGQLITLEVNRYRALSEVNFQKFDIPNKVQLRVPRGRSQFRDAFPETDHFCVGRVYYARDLFVEREVHELDLGFYEAFLLSIEKGGMWTLVRWKSDYFLWSLDGRQLPNVTCQLWEGDGWSGKHCVTTETPTNEVLCNCTRIGYLRLSNETEPELNTTPSGDNFSTEEATTVESLADSTLISTAESSGGTVSTTLELFSTPPTTASTTWIYVAAATESDMITLASRTDASTPSSNAAESVSFKPPANGSSVIEHGPSPLQAGNVSGSGKMAPTDPLRNRPMASSAIAYTILAALGISTLLMTILTVAYRRRRVVLRLADELHSVPNRARTQSPHVRYARFQDEHNMTGDNVSTISDVLTI